MSEDDPTVADVLAEADADETAVALMGYARGDLPADSLDYEDWVRPLKLTGGRVCLELHNERHGRTGWLTRCHTGHLLWMEHTDAPPNVADPAGFKTQMETEWITITPVLRADTPFAAGWETPPGPSDSGADAAKERRGEADDP